MEIGPEKTQEERPRTLGTREQSLAKEDIQVRARKGHKAGAGVHVACTPQGLDSTPENHRL